MQSNSTPAWKDAREAVDLIQSGMTVAVANMNGEPLSLTAELWSRGKQLRDVTILTGLMFTGYKFLNSSNGFNLKTWFIPGTVKGGPSEKINAEYLPITWAQVSPFLEKNQTDVALMQVSPADENGYHSFGTSTSHSRSMLKGARLKIAEVNARMPRTCGDSLVHASEFDVLVSADYPILENPFREGDSVDRAIGMRVAELIRSGSTLQFGIGTIPAAVIDGLISVGARDLKITSQLIDPIRKLIEAGCCTTETVKATVAEVLGTQSLYSWVENNPAVLMCDSRASHSMKGLCSTERFVSVNSALEVDLAGQVNSEFIDGQQVGGIGGSVDFMIGAQDVDALSIIALRSCTRDGASRIVRTLSSDIVTAPRSMTQIVVTEHGVADLRHLTVKERARALAHISHPDYRAELLNAAAQL